MSHQNLETVHRVQEALHAGDYLTAVSEFDPAIEWHNTDSFPGPKICCGPEEVTAFWESFFETFDRQGTEIEDSVASGDTVVVQIHTWGQGRASGAPMDVRWASINRFHNGKIVRVDVHGDYTRALAAAGLSEDAGRVERVAVRRDEPILREATVEFGVDFADLDFEVSPNDRMFAGSMEHYLRGGVWALRCIRRGLVGRAPESILDFGCGHGRVLRMLTLVYPNAELTGADVDADAVEFCRDQFGVNTFLSAEDPRAITVKHTFDLIWVGSVFSHITAANWAHLLRFLDGRLNPTGTLIFTMQGPTAANRLRNGVVDWGLGPERTAELLEQQEGSDFAYVDYPGWTDYGLAVTTIDWARRCVETATTLELTDYNEQGWDGHQDVVTCRKPS